MPDMNPKKFRAILSAINILCASPLTSIILFPLTLIFEQPWNSVPTLFPIISVVYLGLVSTGLAWLLRFSILKKNGLIFQSQVSFLIPIFGIVLGYIFLNELITPKIITSVILVLIGIYLVKRST